MTVLVNVDVSLTFIQTSQHLLPQFLDPAILSIGYILALTKELLSFLALRNEIMGFGVKIFFTSLSIYKGKNFQ